MFSGLYRAQDAQIVCLKAASDGEEEFVRQAAIFVNNNFYVDDGLTSVDDVQEAVELVTQTRAMCSKRGLRLYKFVSNNTDVLRKIPAIERAVDINTL